MKFSKQENEFIEKADNLIVNLPFGEWASTTQYSNPDLFQYILRQYDNIYEIEYDSSLRNFRKIREINICHDGTK